MRSSFIVFFMCALVGLTTASPLPKKDAQSLNATGNAASISANRNSTSSATSAKNNTASASAAAGVNQAQGATKGTSGDLTPQTAAAATDNSQGFGGIFGLFLNATGKDPATLLSDLANNPNAAK